MPASRASRPGLVASDSIVETPPNSHSVMPRTGMPWARATNEWASSWTSTETKNSSAAATETIHSVGVDQPSSWNHDVATDQVTRAKMRIQLGEMEMSMPNSRATLKPDPMLLLGL